jgi:hypothetical protein
LKEQNNPLALTTMFTCGICGEDFGGKDDVGQHKEWCLALGAATPETPIDEQQAPSFSRFNGDDGSGSDDDFSDDDYGSANDHLESPSEVTPKPKVRVPETSNP